MKEFCEKIHIVQSHKYMRLLLNVENANKNSCNIYLFYCIFISKYNVLI